MTWNSSSRNVTCTVRAPACLERVPHRLRMDRIMGRAPRGAAGVFALTVLALATLTACKNGEFKLDAALDQGVQNILQPRRSAQQNMLVAVSDADADVRRDAVVKIAKSKQYKEDWAVKAFIAIACLENDEQTRCVAIRALARTNDARGAETMLKILNHTQHPPEEIYPPTNLVRWDATLALVELSAAGAVSAELLDQAEQTFIDRLANDPERHTRLAAARGLGSYRSRAAVDALIQGLRDGDFAVAYACEDSLVKLTGVTHSASASAWETWRDAHANDLFAQAGQIPESRRPPYTNAWGKMSHDTRDTLDWLWPEAKAK